MRTVFSGEVTQRYLDAVRARLGHLPDGERAEVLEDLEQHLRELAAEPGPGLPDRLGAAADYAEEFVASLGIDRAEVPGATTLDRVRASLDRLRDQPRTVALLAFAGELRPGWWVVRGFLGVAALAALDGPRGSAVLPFPDLVNPLVGTLAAVGLAVASVRLGREAAAGRHRRADTVASLLGVVAVLVAFAHLDGGTRVVYDTTPVPLLDGGEGLVVGPDGVPVTNLFVYDHDGRLLEDVLVYDQAGRPLAVSPEGYDPTTGAALTGRVPIDDNGAPVPNAYPRTVARETYDPRTGVSGTELVRPPAVVVPPLSGGATTTVLAPSPTVTSDPGTPGTTTLRPDADAPPPTSTAVATVPAGTLDGTAAPRPT